MSNYIFLGLGRLFRFWGSFPGPRSKVVEFLQSGEIVSIAPGGLREALFSENYSLIWKNRLGFAKAALEAETVKQHFSMVTCCSYFVLNLWRRKIEILVIC